MALLETLSLSTLDPVSLARLADLLDDEERARADRLKLSPTRREFIAAHGLKRTMLGAVLGQDPRALRFTAESAGKPVLVGGGPDFNLSHTTGLVACAVATDGGRVGVDAETLARTPEPRLARRFFAREEADALQALPHQERPQAFLRLWTLKEAVVKALGGGLALGLKRFAVGTEPPRLLRQEGLLPPGHPCHLEQHCLPSGHVLALAVLPQNAPSKEPDGSSRT
ncbi:4'-phosphopantetheinyl transferase family protein [Pararhodospirillum photometricum]|uniref:4'-phosphopantetheinyl transferase family protein n=1 Tax=Pararhodospirillum photometricum TaxID=1084 RepID=UPI0002DF0F16|nr:4'-phosphopantetheinyl transferase superfamily protein [Pararhodospirillum photometricum]